MHYSVWQKELMLLKRCWTRGDLASQTAMIGRAAIMLAVCLILAASWHVLLVRGGTPANIAFHRTGVFTQVAQFVLFAGCLILTRCRRESRWMFEPLLALFVASYLYFRVLAPHQPWAVATVQEIGVATSYFLGLVAVLNIMLEQRN